MLKRYHTLAFRARSHPAAFRRLCVETPFDLGLPIMSAPAAFRRLCVETRNSPKNTAFARQPPSGGCVLKHAAIVFVGRTICSRLQAAVC